MSLKIKVDRNYIRYLLDKLKILTNESILSFNYDKVSIIIHNTYHILMIFSRNKI
jgi:type III secretory pathway lipoprotein EscJ